MQRVEKQDIYTRITNQIVGHLERGVRPWVKPWNAEHAAGRITRPLRYNGKPYSGINVLTLWASSMAQNFAAPIWMTFKQASELDGQIRKGEKGSLVVYADSILRKQTDEKTGDEIEREIPFLAERVTLSKGGIRAAWLYGGATAMGLGIWAMHYVGMVAYKLPIPVLYDWPTVVISLLAAVIASGVALFVVSGQTMGLGRTLVGSLIMGVAIAGMHYIGMDAMRVQAMWQPPGSFRDRASTGTYPTRHPLRLSGSGRS